MDLQQDCCIRSTPKMEDQYFTNTTLLITELNQGGAIAFILNRPFNRNLNELAEFSFCKPFPLHTGGPIDQEHLHFIHRQPLLISDGQLIMDDLYVGGNFGEAVEAINTGLLSADEIKIFVGYCGWDAGELEAEIAGGDWQIVEVSTDELFQ